MDVQTNPFCAAGMHLPNASYAVFGGNSAVGPGGNNSSPGSTTSYDPTYKTFDGRRAIRIITSCDGDPNSPPCSWFDAPNSLMMAKARWYPGAEALADGTVVLIGGFTAGGYINRNTPNTDPAYEGGAAEPLVGLGRRYISVPLPALWHRQTRRHALVGRRARHPRQLADDGRRLCDRA